MYMILRRLWGFMEKHKRACTTRLAPLRLCSQRCSETQYVRAILGGSQSECAVRHLRKPCLSSWIHCCYCVDRFGNPAWCSCESRFDPGASAQRLKARLV